MIPRASGPAALERRDYIEAVAVAEPHVDDCVSRRRLSRPAAGRRKPTRRWLRKSRVAPAPWRAAAGRKSRPRRSTAIVRRRFSLCRRVGGLARQSVHVVTIICADLTRILACAKPYSHATNSDRAPGLKPLRNVNGRSKSLRLQCSLTTAPRSGMARFSNDNVAPERSSSVLAIKKPRPRPAGSSPVSFW